MAVRQTMEEEVAAVIRLIREAGRDELLLEEARVVLASRVRRQRCTAKGVVVAVMAWSPPREKTRRAESHAEGGVVLPASRAPV